MRRDEIGGRIYLMRFLIQRLVIGAFVVAASMTAGASLIRAQVQETDDKAKIEIYTRFVNNRLSNETLAYRAAKEYLQKYPKDDDVYTRYLRPWVALFDKWERKQRVPQLIYDEKNYAEGYRLGKAVLTEEPDDLATLMYLGYGAYLASTTAKNESFNADARGYALKAIAAIEGGKSPEEWKPFKDKDDALAHLYYTLGFIDFRSAPDQAIDSFIKTARLETDLKKAPSTYYFIAAAYETGPYKTLAAAYQTNFAGKEESPASKAALEKLNVVIDRMIDAYARAIAAAGNDPANAQNKAQWLAKVTDFYKFRNGGSDAGLNEMIAGVLAKPLPAKPA
jgi:hypothetical protein